MLTRDGDCAALRSLRVLANEAPDRPWSDHHGLLADLAVGEVARCGLPLPLAAAATNPPLRRRALLAGAALAALGWLAPG